MVLVARVRPAARGAGLASSLAEPAEEDVMELKPLGGARPPLRRHSFFNHVPSRPTVAPLSPRKSLATFVTTWNEQDEEESSERLGSRRGHSRQNSIRPDVGQVSRGHVGVRTSPSCSPSLKSDVTTRFGHLEGAFLATTPCGASRSVIRSLNCSKTGTVQISA
ncbi:hypothetical protein HPB48_001896 [Haemaphysalis longicornis]|uniref:Uncharacterized protein n=1 Tax=Haemaphysalis longicornis TaxID=44386 RepID=A0A9J6G4J5_HAELO|nr:hypothetical protein HPB48_001896 [Haemaphysalis longicornis]